ncbi:hypothetical protein FIU97_09450 [Roseivivax sp. THAF40]|uniref:hypothetical protein n=1 Tax=Roseivivax sp. THAF40 TaxID=2587858 RepID=UPI001268B123|nr:hypothetical protein [Roseivivax sp. THAF40]QFT46796.1 hypothetical protein FIU97_09450 [Roseivivax sp. THAF40]
MAELVPMPGFSEGGRAEGGGYAFALCFRKSVSKSVSQFVVYVEKFCRSASCFGCLNCFCSVALKQNFVVALKPIIFGYNVITSTEGDHKSVCSAIQTLCSIFSRGCACPKAYDDDRDCFYYHVEASLKFVWRLP